MKKGKGSGARAPSKHFCVGLFKLQNRVKILGPMTLGEPLLSTIKKWGNFQIWTQGGYAIAFVPISKTLTC